MAYLKLTLVEWTLTKLAKVIIGENADWDSRTIHELSRILIVSGYSLVILYTKCSLSKINLVSQVGYAPTTFTLEGYCSILLSYWEI